MLANDSLFQKTALATPSGAVVPQAGDAGAAASETSEAAAASPSGAAAGSAAAGSAAADAGNEETEEEINANTEYSQSEKDAKIKRQEWSTATLFSILSEDLSFSIKH